MVGILGSGIMPVIAAYRGKSHLPFLIGDTDGCPDQVLVYIDRLSHTHVVVYENIAELTPERLFV